MGVCQRVCYRVCYMVCQCDTVSEDVLGVVVLSPTCDCGKSRRSFGSMPRCDSAYLRHRERVRVRLVSVTCGLVLLEVLY